MQSRRSRRFQRRFRGRSASPRSPIEPDEVPAWAKRLDSIVVPAKPVNARCTIHVALACGAALTPPSPANPDDPQIVRAARLAERNPGDHHDEVAERGKPLAAH